MNRPASIGVAAERGAPGWERGKEVSGMDMERLFDEVESVEAAAEPRMHPTNATGRQVLVPATDVFETGDAIVLVADMPGVGPDGVDVTLENGHLTLSGHAADELDGVEREARYMGYGLDDFQRVFSVPERIDRDRITATIRDGVLTVVLPKQVDDGPRHVRVEPG